MTFEIEVPVRWLESETTGNEYDPTRCDLRITVDGLPATQVEVVGVRTVRDSIRVSAAPLALWLASNWWRLRWESERRSADWHMVHRISSVGGGFVWPPMSICGSGTTVQINQRPRRQATFEPVRYLTKVNTYVPAVDFEKQIDLYIGNVIERLDAIDKNHRDLAEMWSEVCAERNDPEIGDWRRLEALIGCNPDQGPHDVVETLLAARERIGPNAVAEFASEFDEQAARQIENIESSIHTNGKSVRIPRSEIRLTPAYSDFATPWRVAESMARLAREAWGLDSGPVSNNQLAALVETSSEWITDDVSGVMAPVSAAARTLGSDLRVILNKRHTVQRRFMLARIMAEHVASDETERLLPCTNARTERQRFQRAFAQEFLCPYDALRSFLDTETPDDEAIEAAAEFFEVSPLGVRSALVNKGVLDRDALAA